MLLTGLERSVMPRKDKLSTRLVLAEALLLEHACS